MVVVDRWFILGVLGLVGMAVSAAGEFLHWWGQFGQFAFWFSLGMTILGFLLNATRAQVSRVGAGVERVDTNTRRIEANTQRIEANTQRIEANTQRIEANTQRIESNTHRIEANTEAIPRIEANTAETVSLLRDIRDRLAAREG